MNTSGTQTAKTTTLQSWTTWFAANVGRRVHRRAAETAARHRRVRDLVRSTTEAENTPMNDMIPIDRWFRRPREAGMRRRPGHRWLGPRTGPNDELMGTLLAAEFIAYRARRPG